MGNGTAASLVRPTARTGDVLARTTETVLNEYVIPLDRVALARQLGGTAAIAYLH